MRSEIVTALAIAVFTMSINTFAPSAASANASVYGTWHCDIPNAVPGPAGTSIDYAFNRNGTGWYASDKTGGGHEALRFKLKGNTMDTWQIRFNPNRFMTRERIVATGGGFKLIALGSIVNGHFNAFKVPNTVLCTPK